MSEMRRKLEAVEQAIDHAETVTFDVMAMKEKKHDAFNSLREAVRKAVLTCAREDKARHVRQQRGGSDE